MKIFRFFIIVILAFFCVASFSASACTSMLVSSRASATGRPLMWKHRDTGSEDNFVEKVPAKNGKMGYVALFNGGDKDLEEAWMGMNDAGFAIMNTASYNLAPDTARLKDMEGYIMSGALQTCRKVDDFELLLKRIKKPLGVQANFGVMDASGGMAYFEVSDHSYVRFDVADSDEGFLIRSNYSVSGNKKDGYGFIRESNLRHVLKEEIAAKSISPESLTEKASKSFWHSILNKDFETDSCQWVIDQDFIPRSISTASIVIEGVNPDSPVDDMIMWTTLGYPPCSVVMPVTLKSVPESLRPTAEGYKSPLCNGVNELKHKVFPLVRGNGPRYIKMDLLRNILKKTRENSLKIYDAAYKLRNHNN